MRMLGMLTLLQYRVCSASPSSYDNAVDASTAREAVVRAPPMLTSPMARAPSPAGSCPPALPPRGDYSKCTLKTSSWEDCQCHDASAALWPPTWASLQNGLPLDASLADPRCCLVTWLADPCDATARSCPRRLTHNIIMAAQAVTCVAQLPCSIAAAAPPAPLQRSESEGMGAPAAGVVAGDQRHTV